MPTASILRFLKTRPRVVPTSGQRVTLRVLARDDMADISEIHGDDAVTLFLPDATWRTHHDASVWFARMDALCAEGNGIQLVIERNTNQKVIGTVLLFRFDEASARIEMSCALGRAHWRQGLAREALTLLCGLLFSRCGVRRIEAQANPDNLAANALLRSLGFVHERRLRNRRVAKGSVYDINLYACLANEWQDKPRMNLMVV